MVCAHSRGRAVLDLHFSRLVGKPSVTDQYVAYETLVIRQACLVHILRHCESVVIRERANAELQRSLENGGDGEGTGAGAEAGGTGAVCGGRQGAPAVPPVAIPVQTHQINRHRIRGGDRGAGSADRGDRGRVRRGTPDAHGPCPRQIQHVGLFAVFRHVL